MNDFYKFKGLPHANALRTTTRFYTGNCWYSSELWIPEARELWDKFLGHSKAESWARLKQV